MGSASSKPCGGVGGGGKGLDAYSAAVCESSERCDMLSRRAFVGCDVVSLTAVALVDA